MTATEKQMNFIDSLLSERELTEEQLTAAREQISEGLTKETASKWISRLLDLPKKNGNGSNGSRPEPEAGMYRAGETIYRVYLGQRSGRMLVKMVVGDQETGYNYEYVGAAAYKLPKDAEPLSLDEAKAWGKMTGTCCVCARRLDNPESVEAGIGPVCAGRMTEGF